MKTGPGKVIDITVTVERTRLTTRKRRTGMLFIGTEVGTGKEYRWWVAVADLRLVSGGGLRVRATRKVE